MRILTHKQNESVIKIGQIRKEVGIMYENESSLLADLTFIVEKETRGLIHAKTYRYSGCTIDIKIDKSQFLEELLENA